MYIIIRWIINALILLLLTRLLPGIQVTGFYAALVAALVLGLVNTVIRPVLIILTLPINILTLGLFTFIINGLMLWFVGTLVKGFAVESFGTAFVGALIMTITNWVVSALVSEKRTVRM
jgi:putative membrane protein